MLEWLESFFSIIGQKLVDYGVESVRSIRDFKNTLVNVERNLQSLRAKASDVEEQIKNAQLSGKKKRKREVENWLEEVQIVGEEILALANEDQGFVKRFFSGNRAGKLNERVDGLLQQSENFSELVLDDNEAKGDPLLATELIDKSSDVTLQKIWKLMVVDKVQSVGIYGMGGVGKTTLAKQIHNRLLKETQYNVYWVTVSQAFTIRGLQDGIAEQMRLSLSDEKNEDNRAAILNRDYRELSQRKDLVLILDDVWEDISLEKLGDPLQVEGCRLIITSRSKKVCHRIGCQEVILVKTLDKNEAWNLFRKTVNSETELDPQVEEIARRMAKKCDGLPLGIIVLAGSMRGVTNIHVWRNSLVELEESLNEQNEMDDKVFGVLRFSFDRLDPNYQTEGSKNGYTNLQLCFLYCSLYREDYKILKKELIEGLISEKWMSRRKTMETQFDLGHAILDTLVSVCLLQEPDNNYVSMHDLVRCMALKIASVNPRFMVYAGLALEEIPNEEEWTEDLDKVSLMENKISELPAGISPNCPKLTTLLLNGNYHLESIPESFFLRMSGLHVLNLSSTGIKELPHSLSDLVRLNTLLLRGCENLVSVPYLGKLKVLEELDLSFTKIKHVPEGMEYLVNLRYLCWFGFSEFEMFPTGLLSKYHHLQILGLSAQVQAPVNEVGNLKKLEQFFGRFGAIGDLNHFTRSRQSQGSIRFYGIDVGVMPQEYGYNCIDNHRKVTMHKCSVSREEYQNDMILLPEDIEELEFVKCEGLRSCLLDDLARVNIPRSLKGLTIKKCEGIECISNEQSIMSLEEDDEPAADSFHSLLLALECINLKGLPNFTCIYGIGSFSSLKSLKIYKCNKIIKKLGLRGADIQNLEEITILDCAEIEEIIQVEEDDRSRVEGVSLPKLKKLNLWRLPRLNCISKAKMVCSSIEQIHIYGCHNIKKMPLFVPNGSTVPPAPLQIHIHPEIHIHPDDEEWWQSVEWEHPIQHRLILHAFNWAKLNSYY